MSELLASAKAVIEDLDNPRVFNVRDVTEQQLRAAVEQAEKQEAMGFDEWWKDHGNGGYHDSLEAWAAAQQAERERIKNVIAELLEPADRDPWIHYSTLLEKIDDV